VRERLHRAEILDGPADDLEELSRSLRQVAQVNRWLGGARALKRHLAPAVCAGASLRILDVGTGNGDTLGELGVWARRRGARWHAVGVELSPWIARLAHRRLDSVVRGDALRLPFADGSFDVALCTLTLHHFPDDEAAVLVGEMARVSRDRVLVNDLERTPPNYWGARALAATLWRGNRITRHDGPLSVLRSFTPSELLEVGRRAGLRGAAVRRHFPWRIVLEGRA
jgi:ubiquinone/menaquinone biosynthesis C-methylase UbiE